MRFKILFAYKLLVFFVAF